MGNITTQARTLRDNIYATLQIIHMNERYTHNNQRERLLRLFSELEYKHKLAAHTMTIALVGAWLGILSAPFHKDATAGKILSGASGFLTKTNDFMLQLGKGAQEKLNGLKQLLLQAMQDGNKTDEYTLNILREIDRMVDEALNKINDATARPFR